MQPLCADLHLSKAELLQRSWNWLFWRERKSAPVYIKTTQLRAPAPSQDVRCLCLTVHNEMRVMSMGFVEEALSKVMKDVEVTENGFTISSVPKALNYNGKISSDTQVLRVSA